MIKFNIDVNDKVIDTDDYWRKCIGSCHAYTALRSDYRKYLETINREIGFKYIRFHGIFNDDMCVLRKSLTGEYIYSFTNIDNIFDYFLSIGIKPFVELGFTPSCIKSGDEKIFHYQANVTPPKDDIWVELITRFINHIIERYGLEEVRKWYFEVWNEPNLGKESGIIGGRFWSGDINDYFHLYKITVEAIKQIDGHLKVGGPATSNNALILEMIEFCTNTATPIDFISTHHYPTDVILGYGVEDSQNFTNAFNSIDWKDKNQLDKLIDEYLTFQKDIWKNVERGVLTQMAKRARKEAGNLPLIYTEWSSLAGLESDGPFGASFIAKTILDNAGIVDGYSYWTFSDIFEEKGVANCEFHGGFGLMTMSGIKKAPYNAFKILSLLGNKRYLTQLQEGTLDVYAFKNESSSLVQILAVNHQSLLHKIEKVNLEITIEGAEILSHIDIYRVDENNANPLKVWKEMGSHPYLDEQERLLLNAASQLKREKMLINSNSFSIEVPEQGIALVTIYLK